MSATDTQLESVRAAVEPAVVELGLAVYDVELLGGAGARTLRLTVTGPDGRRSRDDHRGHTGGVADRRPIMESGPATIGGSYLLEVSSPGIERALRRPEHFREALGEEVSVKFHTDAGPRRVRGVLRAFDGDHCVIESDDGGDEEIAITAITQARTVFEWGPQPRQGSKTRSRARAKGKS